MVAASLVSLLLLGYVGVAQLFPGVVVLGLFSRPVTTSGIFAGLATGISIAVFLILTGHDPYMGLNAGFIAMCFNFAVTGVVSLLTKAGHVSRQMLKRYSHVRLDAKRTALSALDGSFVPLAPEPPKLLPENAVTNQVVLDMLTSGIPAEIIIAKIKGARCAFDTSLETIKQLRQAQVPDAVIVVMLRRGQERA